MPTVCSGLADFTLCSVVTDPDREYDICINGVCHSPGCGTPECNAPGPNFPLPDTNQRQCYDMTAPITCPAGGDFFGQDAQYGWDLIHEEDERYSKAFTMATEPVVTDNVTGLIWQGCTGGLSGSDCTDGFADEMDWIDAVPYCDALAWGGHTDWRLPNEYELQSIVHYGIFSPCIDENAFPNTPGSKFWTSSVHPSGGAFQSVAFKYGNVSFPVTRGDIFARCVRSEPHPTPPRFIKGGGVEPVVTDDESRLLWQGCAAGYTGEDCAGGSANTMEWAQALQYCESLIWGGYSDWRLPDIIELQSIVDNFRMEPAVDETFFPTLRNSVHWASSTNAYYEDYAFCVTFNLGNVAYEHKINVHEVRCVRNEP